MCVQYCNTETDELQQCFECNKDYAMVEKTPDRPGHSLTKHTALAPFTRRPVLGGKAEAPLPLGVRSAPRTPRGKGA